MKVNNISFAINTLLTNNNGLMCILLRIKWWLEVILFELYFQIYRNNFKCV